MKIVISPYLKIVQIEVSYWSFSGRDEHNRDEVRRKRRGRWGDLWLAGEILRHVVRSNHLHTPRVPDAETRWRTSPNMDYQCCYMSHQLFYKLMEKLSKCPFAMCLCKGDIIIYIFTCSENWDCRLMEELLLFCNNLAIFESSRGGLGLSEFDIFPWEFHTTLCLCLIISQFSEWLE